MLLNLSNNSSEFIHELEELSKRTAGNASASDAELLATMPESSARTSVYSQLGCFSMLEMLYSS